MNRVLDCKIYYTDNQGFWRTETSSGPRQSHSGGSVGEAPRNPRQMCMWTRPIQEHKKKLDNVAINDGLPLKAARCDAIANVASDTRDLISMVIFIFAMRRHLVGFASAPFPFSRLATFPSFG